jgi:hypothetical protein
LRHQQIAQVGREEERSTRNPIAAIVRHAREYALENGGMRSRFSALRLPGWIGRYAIPKYPPLFDAGARCEHVGIDVTPLARRSAV